MTSASFNSYKIYQYYEMAVLGNAMQTAIGTNAPELPSYTWQGMFMHMYTDFLCRWELECYEADETDYDNNFVAPSEAQCLAQLSNTIFGTKFCVDFYKDLTETGCA